ncbi:MAG: pentapeptide repeat-containing protein, partial [Cyanobacteria bacterium J06554_11]
MLIEPIIDKAFDAVLKVTGIEEKVNRNERVIRLLQRIGLDSLESLKSFEDVYAYAVVQYAFDAEGQRKPAELIQFFRLKEMRDVFKVAYVQADGRSWLEKGQAIARYQLKDTLLGIDPARELSEFAVAFVEVVKETRSPKEIRQDQKLDSLQRQIQTMQGQLQQLPTLEAINQTMGQLVGAAQPALPAAAQSSQAAELAHRLGEWFDVLDYERVPEYEVWAADYFEWAIDFPITRRKMSRTLVRGVAGEVEMGELQAFARAIEAAGADEGWLVANRRVSKAARQAVQSEEVYADISCYTFDELLDEDADFSKYLDWLENEIKTKGVDAGYLPLACRKDELDPVTQRKMGVSTYAEEDGWIDGYVDMWLDDPAKEHLSVLGEFGTGKTWFALHYAWRALQRYREAKKRGTQRPRIPVVVPLRDYAKAVSVESLFSEFFFRKHEILKNYSVFEQLNRMGKLLLIFDGFDEMAARVDRQAMIDNFWELAKVVVPGAKAILTCRTEHFPDAIEGRRLLNAELKASTSDRTGEPPQFEVLELEKFADEQIERLLGQKAQVETVQMVLGNSQLLDLARRPVMVDLILEALPDIEAGKPVDMARVYLYAVTRKMEKDIRSERTFTSMADKLYFLCELSWEMLSTNRMSLNYRDFPERLEEMFADRVKEEKELDHWRYDMMGQTMLIRNSEGDYSPAHRSLLEFFVAYKIVASLGAMAEDFTTVAREQSHLDEALHGQDYTWEEYFKRDCDDSGVPETIPPLYQFSGMSFEELLPLLSETKTAKAVLDLAHPMLNEETMRSQLLPLLQATAQWSMQKVGYFGGNVVQLMLARSPYALEGADLKDTKIKGVDFSRTYLRRVSLKDTCLSEVSFSKALGGVNSVAYSPDGNRLAIGDNKGILQVWDINTSRVVSFSRGHEDSISSIVYSPNGEYIASAGFDRVAKLWEVVSGKCIHVLRGHYKGLRSLTYSPDGQQIASSSEDRTIKVWNAMTGECIHTLQGHETPILSVVFSPDGELIISAGEDKIIKIWNTVSGKSVCTLQGHKDWIKSVICSPDGKHLASASYDKTVKIWDVAAGRCIRTLQSHKDSVRSVTYSPDGKHLASASYDKTVKIWDVATGQCIRTIQSHGNRVWTVIYSPDGQQLASACDDRTVKIWNAVSGECLHILQSHEDWIMSVVYSPDGQQLASACDDKTVKVWDIALGKRIHTLQGHEDWILSVVYSPDGQQLASACDDETVRIWNVALEECIRTLRGHQGWVRSVTYSPDGRQLASSSSDRTVKIWDVASGR